MTFHAEWITGMLVPHFWGSHANRSDRQTEIGAILGLRRKSIFTQAEPDHGRMVSYLGHEWTTMLNAYQRGQSGQRESEPPLRENKPPTNQNQGPISDVRVEV